MKSRFQISKQMINETIILIQHSAGICEYTIHHYCICAYKTTKEAFVYLRRVFCMGAKQLHAYVRRSSHCVAAVYVLYGRRKLNTTGVCHARWKSWALPLTVRYCSLGRHEAIMSALSRLTISYENICVMHRRYRYDNIYIDTRIIGNETATVIQIYGSDKGGSTPAVFDS